MTEKEYYRILKRERIFYSILIFFWLAAIIYKLSSNFDNKYWIWLIAGSIIYLFLKDIFTGLKWSHRLEKPKDNNISSAITEKEYQKKLLTYPFISSIEKQGYVELTELCLSRENRNKLIAFFDGLKDFSQDRESITTLNYVMDYLDEHNIHFLMRLDWKASIEDLIWRLSGSLQDNYNISIDLPKLENYPRQASISYNNVFQDFNKSLIQNSFQIGFIDTQSDEYIILVHKIEDKERVEMAVNKIGYKYFQK